MGEAPRQVIGNAVGGDHPRSFFGGDIYLAGRRWVLDRWNWCYGDLLSGIEVGMRSQ